MGNCQLVIGNIISVIDFKAGIIPTTFFTVCIVVPPLSAVVVCLCVAYSGVATPETI